MKVRLKQQGTTLVELIIGMALLTMVLAAVYGVFVTAIKSKEHTAVVGTDAQASREILNTIMTELRQAVYIDLAENTPSSFIYYRHAGDEANRTIALGTGENSGYIIFLDSAGLERKLGAGKMESLAFTVTNVDGETGQPSKRRITIRLQTQDFAPTELTTTVVTFNAF